jgi:hypothetical protein
LSGVYAMSNLAVAGHSSQSVDEDHVLKYDINK